MDDSFWALCNSASVALHRMEFAAATRLLDEASSMLDHRLPDVQFRASRHNHLGRLRKLLHELGENGNSPQSAANRLPPHRNDLNVNVPSTAKVRESDASNRDLVQTLTERIRLLEQEKSEFAKRIRSMPSVDPLCIGPSDPPLPEQKKEDFGIIVFGHTRQDTLEAVLESLRRQDALRYTEVWLDGFQGNLNFKAATERTYQVVRKYPVRAARRQSSQFGFRKMLILGLVEMCRKYRDILILEDDCFPARDAVAQFRDELERIRDDKSIFSVYGHHFLVESEKETCPRFQGWGWGTTSQKLMPMLRQLIDCYSMTEERYLEFVRLALTPDIKARIDVTPPRQPSYVLENFFAWDETVCLLSALGGQVHRPTRKRTIYNCGMGEDSTHFVNAEKYRAPPFNLITPGEVWRYF